MVILIKNIEASFIEPIESNIIYVKTVEGEVQEEDYINLFGFKAYLQNLTKVEQSAKMTNPQIYGLRNQFNLPLITLNIDY